ncbi:MAG TPA: hypothetical protein VM573_01740 [Actinomycetota bacterium]|nr:hypothetical protein [Actinomycetota bacterium]
MRRLIALGAAAALLAAAPAATAAKAPKPAMVFEDPADDAGNQGTALPGASEGGFDLIKGEIVKKGKNLEFVVTHKTMPSTGTLPEGFRFLWHFTVDGEDYRFTAKSADIGKPDVLAQSGTDRIGQVDTDGHFRLEQCVDEPLPAVLTLINCRPVEYLEGSFDPDAASFTIVLPLALVKAKKGTSIGGAASGAAASGCQICWVPHYAERSLTPHTIIDAAAMSVVYKVPKK